MADVRSLLKSERANRRINHPYALYSESGKLSCSLCDILIKAESAWKSHIRTPDHAKRALRAAEAAAEQNSRKRKADSDEEVEEDTHKRARAEVEDDKTVEHEVEEAPQPTQKRTVHFAADTKDPDEPSETPSTAAMIATPPLDPSLLDDPEWLELQRLAAAPSLATQPAYAGATISAAPMSAEEIAAQAREEDSARSQKELREAELEAEKEDAAQALEAEFDEMDELEERVKALREKREALRNGGGQLMETDTALEALNGKDDDIPAPAEEDDDDDDEDDDDDVWNFGAD